MHTPEQVAEQAMAAFWAKVAQLWPTATTGDLAAGSAIPFENAAREAVTEWFVTNVPEDAPEEEPLPKLTPLEQDFRSLMDNFHSHLRQARSTVDDAFERMAGGYVIRRGSVTSQILGREAEYVDDLYAKIDQFLAILPYLSQNELVRTDVIDRLMTRNDAVIYAAVNEKRKPR